MNSIENIYNTLNLVKLMKISMKEISWNKNEWMKYKKEWDLIVDIYKKDTLEKTYLISKDEFNVQDSNEFIKIINDYFQQNPDKYEKFFTFYDGNELIGFIEFIQKDKRLGIAEYSIGIDKKYRGKKYGEKILKLFLLKIFNLEQWLKIICIHIFQYNIPSIKMHENTIEEMKNDKKYNFLNFKIGFSKRKKEYEINFIKK